MSAKHTTVAALCCAFIRCAPEDQLGLLHAELAIDPPSIDFGEVSVGGRHLAPVLLVNRGDGPLRITAVEVDSALGPELSLEDAPASLVAGQRAMVNVVFAPLALGTRSGAITFETDAEKSPRVVLGVRATAVRPALEIVPPSFDFGAVVVGSLARETVTLLNTSSRPLAIGRIESSQSELGAELPAELVIDPRSIAELVLTYRPIDLGPDAAEIKVFESNGAAAALTARGLGVPSEIVVRPGVLDFVVNAAEMETRSFVIENAGSKAHAVTSIAVAGGRNFSLRAGSIGALPFSIEPGGTRQIDVEYRPANAGFDSARIAVASDGIALPGIAVVALIGRAQGIPVPDIDVSPSALDFGFGTVGVDTPREILIQSTGGVELQLGGVPQISPADAPFEIRNPPPSVMRPGEVRPMYVVFRPSLAGPAPAASLIITSNDPDEPTLSVPLTAFGTDATSPNLVIAPDPVDFGRVPRGTAASRSVRLENVGSLELQVTELALIDDAGLRFSIAPPSTPLTIAAGSSASLFTASYYDYGLQGIHGGRMRIASNDPVRSLLEVVLVAETVAPPPADLDFSIELGWDTTDTDVDLHFLRPAGNYFDRTSDNCFCNTNPDWGAAGDFTDDPFMDLDDIDGLGPERINLARAVESGVYRVLVHYYAARGNGASTASIHIQSRSNDVATASHVLAEGQVWRVGSIEWNATTRTGTYFSEDVVEATALTRCQ